MALSKDFVKHIHALIHARLVNLGFKKRTLGILTLEISEDALGWIGLNKAVYAGSDSVTINPVVGVRNQRVEKLIADLCGNPFDEYGPPSFAGNIGYIAPEDNYHTFTFSPDELPEGPADELAGYVAEHGVPFIKKNADLRVLVKSMQTPTLRLANADLTCRLPAGLYLLGRYDEAQAYLKKQLEKIGASKDPASQIYRGFAAKLSEQMARSTATPH